MRRIWDEVRERFATFETAKGAYYLVFGLALIFNQQYIISVLAVILVIEGIRKLIVNRTKQALRFEQLKRNREEREHDHA